MKKILPNNAILIPDNAQCVFQGKIFGVYQWPQKLFDGSQATFELLKRPDTVQIIAVHEDKIILVDDEQPGRSSRVHFPGGRVDANDKSWAQAAKRELKEETGYSFKEWRLIHVEQPVPKIEWFVPWFLAYDLEAKGEQQLDEGEKIKLIEVDFDTIRNQILGGRESTLSYAITLFSQVKSLKELVNMKQFSCQSVDI